MENHENFTRVLSKKLLYCAIIFEIVAVTAGLVIAVGALYEAIEASPQQGEVLDLLENRLGCTVA